MLGAAVEESTRGQPGQTLKRSTRKMTLDVISHLQKKANLNKPNNPLVTKKVGVGLHREANRRVEVEAELLVGLGDVTVTMEVVKVLGTSTWRMTMLATNEAVIVNPSRVTLIGTSRHQTEAKKLEVKRSSEEMPAALVPNIPVGEKGPKRPKGPLRATTKMPAVAMRNVKRRGTLF